jgi:hypothetical protein
MKPTQRLLPSLLAALALAAPSAFAYPNLTNVVEFGGDNEAADTIPAKWTGVTYNATVNNEPIPGITIGTPYTVPVFGEDVPCMVDRNHQWNGARADLPIPGYLLGGEYIMIGNDNRDNSPFREDIYVAERSVVFVMIDNRCGDNTPSGGQGADVPGNPPFGGIPVDQWGGMHWVNTNGFQPFMTGYNRDADPSKPDEIAYDEGSGGVGPGVSIDQYTSIYYKIVDPGAPGTPAVSTGEQNNNLVGGGKDMYGVVVVPAQPAKPVLQAGGMDGAVALSWPAAARATNYIVRRSFVNGGPYTDLAMTATPGYTDSGLTNGQFYYYVVAAVSMFGANVSDQAVGVPKNAPDNLVAVGGTNQVSLSWNPMGGTTGYTVKRANNSGGPYSNVATGVAATTYVDNTAAAGHLYYYTVSASLSGGGESGNAGEASAVTAPNTPSSFVAEVFAATVIRLSWNTADTALPTTLVEKSSDGSNFSPLGAVTNGGKHYFDTGLATNSTSYYRVRATNATGFSGYTSTSSASTPASGLNVNFAASTFASAPSYPIPGYSEDFGDAYGDRGNGYNYGWDSDNTANGRYVNSPSSPDDRYDTHMQTPAGRIWELDIASGLYLAHIVCGDPLSLNSTFQWDLEGWVSLPKNPTLNNVWQDFLLTTKVEDGKLTITSGPDADNNKICFLDLYPTTPQPNSIATQPASQTILQNRPVSLNVEVGGGPEPYRYQWYGPAGLIAGATAATYTIPFPQPTDAGAYYVVVTNAGASIQSSNATLTVTPDTSGPVPVQARRPSACTDTLVTVTFDELLDPTTATDINSYEIVNLTYGFSLGALAATPVLERDGKTVELAAASPLTNAALYKVIVKNVKDLALNSSGIVNTLITLNGALVPSGPQNFVVAEAENFDVNTPRVYNAGSGDTEYYWQFENTRAGFSGAGVMHNLPDIEGNRPSGNEGCSLDFCVNFPAAGTYYFWVRGGANDGAANSVHIGIDGTVPATGVNLQDSFDTPGYAWCGWINGARNDRAYVDVPGAGLHTVHIFMREDGFFADKLLLTTDVNYQPEGLGPAETSREQANVPMIEIISGSLHVTGSNVSMNVQTVQGLNNIVEYKNSLTDANWTTMNSFTGSGAIVPVTDSGPLPSRRFYRARVVIP